MTSAGRSSESAKGTAVQLRNLEESLLDTTVRRDRKRLRLMLAENFMEFGSSGRTWTRSSIIEMLSRETAFVPPAIQDFQCALLSDDVALVTYKTVRSVPDSGEVLSSLRSSIWTNEAGNWRMRFHQGTRTAADGSLR
jgi:hypothetical protein